MANPFTGIFDNIWASDGTIGYGPTYDGGRTMQKVFFNQPTPLQELIIQRQREMEAAQRAARKADDPLDKTIAKWREESAQKLREQKEFRTASPKPDPPMPKLVELRPKRQIQLED